MQPSDSSAEIRLLGVVVVQDRSGETCQESIAVIQDTDDSDLGQEGGTGSNEKGLDF